TGTGMTPEVVERAIQPFFTTKEVGKGSGLGLSMIYGFARQSGGHLKIYSEAGHGTTVKLFLPRAAAAAKAAAREAETVVEETRGSEAILVVEDEPDVRALVVRHLSSLGYTVHAADNGPSALKIVDSGVPIDLLFSDMVMPAG